jgi:hypothetical protein
VEGDKKTEKESRTEIHKTEFVDKRLPMIHYERQEQTDMNKSTFICIAVADKTSADALKTFEKVKASVEKGKG